MCWTRGPPCAVNAAGPRDAVELFVPCQTLLLERSCGVEPLGDVQYFHSPHFVAAGDVMAAFAEAKYSEACGGDVVIVAQYAETRGENWAENVTANGGASWRTQLPIYVRPDGEYVHELRKPMAVVNNGNKIYLLVVKYTKSKFGPSVFTDWELLLTVGEIKSAEQGGRTIAWQQTLELPLSRVTNELKQRLWDVFSYGVWGSAFLTRDGKVTFVVHAMKDFKYVSAIIYLEDAGRELGFSHVEIAKNCRSSFFFEWEGKLIMVPADCRGGSNRMQESADMGKTWREAEGPISRLWDTFQGKRDFTPVTIDNKTVLLFTETKVKPTNAKMMHEISLWFTDGSRVHNVGQILANDDYSSFRDVLYTNGELFSLHQKWIRKSKRIILTRLKNSLKNIRLVLNIWAEKDAYLSRPCNESAPEVVSPDTLCVTPMPTDGLVGFLSNTSNDSHWRDEYLYVDAVVKGGTKVKNGFMFSGVGAGAVWPVGRKYSGKRYDFGRHGLTVAATVTIYEGSGNDSPLLTVDGFRGGERLGLWHGRDKQWKIRFEGGGSLTGVAVTYKTWETNKTYRVALRLQDRWFSAYVDGEHVGGLFYVPSPGNELIDIEHIFIAAYGDNSIKNTFSDLVVTNVLLYNRPLNASELRALGKKVTGASDGHNRHTNRLPVRFCAYAHGCSSGAVAGIVGHCRSPLSDNNANVGFPLEYVHSM